MWGRIRGWRGRSGLDKVDLYTRGSLYGMVWLGVAGQSALSLTRPVRASAAPSLIAAACLLSVVQGLHASRMTSTALDTYLGRAAVRGGQLLCGAVLLAANLAATLWLAESAGPGGFPDLWIALGGAVLPLGMWSSLSVRLRPLALAHVGLLSTVCGACALVGGREPALSALVSVGFWGCWTVLTSRGSAWMLDVMWKLREARDVQARLAVAEERLRFGRDMHDVLGRNLAVIALKSELAVELAQRGKPQALDQMVEVQRIARASQQEVRDVVRGYREADLRTELTGAQSVLRAAGIECGIEGDSGAGLPAPVQSALGWVVREAATNVLRHGDPRRCTIRLGATADTVVLDVENDGAGAPVATAGARGSGLAGLRERLGTLDGSLDAGPAGNGLFRLTATIPVPQPRTDPLEEER
ncbi:sensor histidine kinase [Streptomyces sp. NRRL B-24720]|uniref:sensor histidine kinase n=1 Tax=Streptomyces sp. NRRL B-24720 TaxID=1476876 RepID=UPI0004C932BA|nr:histidine kinase [Streptomyces sp. NRRL B-24720]